MAMYLFAVLIGVIAGLRAMTAPAAVSLAAYAGGAAARSRLAAKLGKDLPAALIEDAVAIGGAAAIILAAT